MKKLNLIFLVFCMCGIASTAYAGSYIEKNVITFYESPESTKSYSIDEIPKVKVRYKLPEGEDTFLLKLSGDEGNSDIIRMIPNTGIKSYTYELPVEQEGTHEFTLELLKNGETVYSTNYTKSYVRSVEKGYGSRGFCTHFGHGTYGADDAELLAAAGTEIYRDGTYWSIETSKGHYDFTNYNINFKKINEKNIELFYCSSGTNNLYLNEDADLTEANKIEDEAEREAAILAAKKKIVTEEQIEGFANYTLEVAKRYPDVTKFEIMNEPGFSYTGSEYLNIVKVVAKKLKEYNKDLKVYAGCIVNDSRSVDGTGKAFMEQFMTEDLYPYIDAVSYHIYTHWWYAENNEFNLQHNNYNEIIADQGGWKPLTITETGWQMSVGSHIQGAEEKKQASELVKRAVILDDLGYSDLMFYDFKNDGNDISDPEHNFGVIKNNQSAKMSYYSIKNYLKNVGKAQYLGKALFDNRIEAYAYKSNDGNFLITWAKPDNTQTNIANNNNSNPEYTFSYDVTIKDMFGEKTKSKNTLKSDYDPKYVYGFTDRQILDMLATYGTDELISLPEEQKECEASIKEEYLKLLNVGTKDALDEYIDFCYSKGDKLIEEYKAGTLNIKASEFSNMLYNIHNAAYKGSRTAVCITGLSSEVSIEDISAEYEKTDALIEFADMIKLRYLSEPFNKGKELLKKTKKYSEEGRGTPKSGENYNLQSDGSLKIKGAEDAEFTAVEIYSGTELVWRDTIIKADGNEAELTLPEFGEYILKTSETKDQIITYSGDNYYSCEDAMTYCNAENSKRLLTWTKTLAEDFFESKSSGLPSYITKKTEAGRNYLSINKPEKEGTILAAAYKDGTLKAAAIAGEDGICVLDVTGLDNYTLKIFDWKKSMVPSGAAEVYDGIKA